MLIDRFCAHCHAETLFEQPPCADGHGADCPEWVCTACGVAILLAPVPAAAPHRRAAAA